MADTSPALYRARNLLLFGLKATLSATLLWFVLSQAGFATVTAMIGRIDPVYFLLACLTVTTMVVIGAVRWHVLLMGQYPMRQVIPIGLIGSFFNVFMPGVVGGDAMKVYYLYRNSGKAVEAMASVFMDRYLGYMSLLCIGLMAYPFGFDYFNGTWVLTLMPLFAVLFILASMVLFILKPGRSISAIAKAHEYFGKYRGQSAVLFKAITIGLMIHCLSIVCVFILCKGLSIEMDTGALLIVVPITATLAALPISISGVGIREAAMMLMLGKLGIAPQEATALSFAWFLAIAAGGLPGMLIYLLRRQQHTVGRCS